MPRYYADAAAPGLNRLTAAFISGGDRKQRAFDDEMKSLANVDYLRARTGKADTEAASLQDRRAYLGNQDQYVSDASGAPLPLVARAREYLQGRRPAQLDPQEAEQMADQGTPRPDPVAVAEVASEVKPFLSKILNAVAQRGTVLSATHSDPNQIAQAGQRLRDTSLEDQALAGQITPEELGAVRAAIGGKALYSDAQGRVLDRFRGTLDEGGEQAQANVDLTGARTEHQTAAAESARALAGVRRNPVGKTPARVTTIEWAARNLFDGDMQKAADWEATSRNKSTGAVYLDLTTKLSNANPRLARDPVALDKAVRDAMRAAGIAAAPASPKAAPAPAYKSADEVRAAVKAGKLKRADALEILRNDFGME